MGDDEELGLDDEAEKMDYGPEDSQEVAPEMD
jgi:hypothetical protein